jgi:Zn-dependent protease
LIVRLFFVVPFVYGFAAVSIPPFIFSLIQDSSGRIYQDGEFEPQQVAMLWVVRLSLLLLAVSPGAICITSAFAAVQFLRGKQSGRIWAIACGAAFLAGSAPLLVGSAIMARYSGSSSNGWLGLPVFGLIQVAAGILIMIAFLPQESGGQPLFQMTRPARIKGDGTASLSLYVAVAVMVGGLFLGNSLCQRWSLQANLPSNSNFLHANLIWFGALILAITFHELGHIVAGQMVGMKLLSFRIGPLHAALEDGRWQFVLPRSWKCVFAGGVSMIPKNPLSYNRWQSISGAAGGTLANLFVGSIALLGMLTAKGSHYEASWEFLGQLATINLVFFAGNLIPAQETATYSDGARIYQILTGSVLEDYRRILAMAQATTVTLLRPKDFDIELVERIAATNTPSLDHTFLLLVACDYYFDGGEMESATRKFREAETRYDQEKIYWAERCGSFVLRAACLLADRAMAEKWWQRSLSAKSWNPGKKDYFPACAYFTITCHQPEAEEAWRAEFERANLLPESGGRDFDLYYLGRLREMLDEVTKQAANAPPVMLRE